MVATKTKTSTVQHYQLLQRIPYTVQDTTTELEKIAGKSLHCPFIHHSTECQDRKYDYCQTVPFRMFRIRSY
jgi:hypothetical protein